jgi:phospholipase C
MHITEGGGYFDHISPPKNSKYDEQPYVKVLPSVIVHHVIISSYACVRAIDMVIVSPFGRLDSLQSVIISRMWRLNIHQWFDSYNGIGLMPRVNLIHVID